MKADRFYTLRELATERVFPQSQSHLRRVAQLQQKDQATFEGKVRMSWVAVNSFPRFTSLGGRWGLYASQIEQHRREKGIDV